MTLRAHNITMKRLIGFYVLTTTILIFTVNSAWASTPSGIFKEVDGQAEIKNSDGKIIASTAIKSKRLIKKGAPFYEGETIVTGQSGKIRIQFAEGNNEVLLGPNTTLVIQKAPFDLRMKRGTKLFLESGSIDSVIKQKYSGSDGDEFTVETKTLVAGVRGTVFSVQHDSSTNVSTVAVSRGVVEVKSSSDLLVRGTLTAGESIDSARWQTRKPVATPPKPAAVDPRN